MVCDQDMKLKENIQRLSIIILFLQNGFHSSAQTFSSKNYPKDYFEWPVGAEIGIAANFGELRPNHYHMGLDCRTDQKENVPVLAAADGYIAKVKIEPYGFGRCIYINHPNGLTTLYAHLNTFEPALEKYVTERQYAMKQWNVFIDIPADLFPVKKGDFIASSGNTGGSQGPHTHFEIRDAKSDKCLNPLLFGLPLEDSIPPNIIRLAVYDRTMSTYDQSPKIFPLKKINGVFTPAGGKITASSDRISFAVTAFDRYTGSSNQNGIYGAIVFSDDHEISRFEIDSISYDETRYLNAHTDYRLRAAGGSWLQHLSPLPGYVHGIYRTEVPGGIISVNGTSHEIKIIIGDANGNTSEIKFTLEPPVNTVAKNPVTATQKFIPNYLNIFENNNLRFYLPENALYDTVNFIYKEIGSGASAVYQLHNATIPVHVYFPVSIRNPFTDIDTSKIVMERAYGGKQDFKKAVLSKGWCTASFREFGNYRLLVDSIPPAVVPVGFRNGMNASKSSRILFSVTDNTEEIGSFTALLDGNWLRFTNDKGRNFIYYFDEHCPPGEHELKIIVKDQVGNITEKTFSFTR